MGYAIGVDIGGTKVAIAMVKKTGDVISETILPTDLTIPPRSMITLICDEIKQLMTDAKLAQSAIIGIGIGAPGPLDSKKGVITNPPNLSGWIDIPISAIMEQKCSLPVTLENDANAAALAEKWLGAAMGNENMTYITVSTGIGAGIIADGKLLRGRKGNAGDIGHMVVDPSFGPCACGQLGCLEAIASGTAIAAKGSQIVGEALTTKAVFRYYEQGHPEIVPYIDRVFTVLGIACVTVINTVDPEKIVIGGGVSKVGEPLFQAIRMYVSQYALNETGRNTAIVPAKLGQQSGVIGAAALCFIDE